MKRTRADVSRAALLALGVAAGASQGIAAGAVAAEFDCLIQPRQVVSVNGPVEALIADIKVDRGDRVRKGDVLVEFDAGMERATLELARHRAGMTGALDARQIRYDHARLRHGRNEQLTRKDFVSRQEYEDAEAEYRLSEAELREAKDDLRQAQLEVRRAAAALQQRILVSPLDGIVTDRLLHPGDVSEFGREPILKIAEIDHLLVETILPASVYRQVKAGDKAIVRPELPIGGQVEAEVEVVDQVVDASSGTFGVRLQLDNKDHAIPAGFRCRAEFPGIGEQPLIPLQAPRDATAR